MMLLAFVLFVMIVFWLSVYGLFWYIFCYPERKRPNAHHIPESALYKTYRELMQKGVEDMDNTPGEDVSIISRDGCMLCGRLYVFRKKAPLMIFFHGYHGVPAWDGYGFFKICKKHGINILMADQRAHGKSRGRFITFGIRERYDCKQWAEYAAQRFGEKTDIFLAGVSMGAASVLMSSELGLPQTVKALLADCGYSEPAAIMKETVRKMGFPVRLTYALISLGARVFGHIDLEETTALSAVKSLQIPVLFLHGKQDSIVSLTMSDALYESSASQKERVVIEGADHANSAMTDFEAYEKAVLRFLCQKCGYCFANGNTSCKGETI